MKQNESWNRYKIDPSSMIMESRIFVLKNKQEISWPQLISILKRNEVVLLGEKHDEALHHLMQSQVIYALYSGVENQVIGFEQFSYSKASYRFDSAQRISDQLKSIAKGLNWKRSGWPEWSIYEPVFEAGMRTHSRMVGLDLSQKDLEGLKAGRLDGFDKALLRQVSFEEGLKPPKLMKELKDELIKMHPKEVKPEVLEKMQRIQRARDLQMALQIEKQLNGGVRLVGIMGLGHTRKDRGVPYYLRKLRPKLKIISVCLGQADLLKASGYDRQACDILIETPKTFSEGG